MRGEGDACEGREAQGFCCRSGSSSSPVKIAYEDVDGVRRRRCSSVDMHRPANGGRGDLGASSPQRMVLLRYTSPSSVADKLVVLPPKSENSTFQYARRKLALLLPFVCLLNFLLLLI